MSTGTIKKTPTMRRLEIQKGIELETWLPEAVARLGSIETAADELGIAKATLYNWAYRLGFQRGLVRR